MKDFLKEWGEYIKALIIAIGMITPCLLLIMVPALPIVIALVFLDLHLITFIVGTSVWIVISVPFMILIMEKIGIEL